MYILSVKAKHGLIYNESITSQWLELSGTNTAVPIILIDNRSPAGHACTCRRVRCMLPV